MSPNTIRDMIRAVIPECKVETAGEDCNFNIVVTSPVFAGMSPLARHRMVNDVFKAQFASGELHALSIKTKAE